MEDRPDFGADYARTPMDRHASYDQRLRCMWRHCAGDIPLWQIVLGKHGVQAGYRPVCGAGLWRKHVAPVVHPNRKVCQLFSFIMKSRMRVDQPW